MSAPSLEDQVMFAIKAIFTQEKNKQTYRLCLNDMFPKTAKKSGINDDFHLQK